MLAHPEDNNDICLFWNKVFGKPCYIPNAVLEWRWHDTFPGSMYGTADIRENNTEAIFRIRDYMGAAVIMGDALEKNSHHYFEVQITSRIIEEGMVIGIGYSNNPVQGNANRGLAALALASRHSVGISNSGKLCKDQKLTLTCKGYRLGDVVGVRIDHWHGCVEFFVNRQTQGVAVFNLRNQNYWYPIVLSCYNSSVRLLYSASYQGCLVSLAARKLNIYAEWANLAPGLRNLLKTYFWLLYPDDTYNDLGFKHG